MGVQVSSSALGATICMSIWMLKPIKYVISNLLGNKIDVEKVQYIPIQIQRMRRVQ
jgi:hypothetical protein